MSAVRRPCACGGTVTALLDDPVPGVREHNATPLHRAWSDLTTWSPRTAFDPTARDGSGDVSRVRRVRPVQRHPRGRLVPR